MKGSAFKLNEVATKSVLKHTGTKKHIHKGEGKSPNEMKSPMKSEVEWFVNPKSREPNAPQGTPQWGHGPNERGEYIEYDNKGRAEHVKAEHSKSPNEMKSPLEHQGRIVYENTPPRFGEEGGPQMKSPMKDTSTEDAKKGTSRMAPAFPGLDIEAKAEKINEYWDKHDMQHKTGVLDDDHNKVEGHAKGKEITEETTEETTPTSPIAP